MQRLIIIVLGLALCSGFMLTGVAAEKTEVEKGAADAITRNWIDVTEKVLGNPADKGGWAEDENGKVYRSEDGNWIKVNHSKFGTYLVDLPNKKVMKLEGDKKIEVKDPQLIQRDFGTSLVFKSDTVKLRMKFTEQVSGMKHIEGIKGM